MYYLFLFFFSVSFKENPDHVRADSNYPCEVIETTTDSKTTANTDQNNTTTNSTVHSINTANSISPKRVTAPITNNEMSTDSTEQMRATTELGNNYISTIPTTTTNISNCCVCVSISNIPVDPQQKTHEIKRKLVIDSKTLSLYQRTKMSASDTRPSSVAIGAVAVTVLVAVVLVIVLADLQYLLQFDRN